MYSTPRFPAWRPDKIVMEQQTSGASERPSWKCASVEIIGADSRPLFAQKGEQAQMIEQDGVVRTPSDHMGIVAELIYTDRTL
mmetsp:Transcript_5767/g.7787  ORF Transcript_5767/g.7787 Transcript_5767/m.7787 type:complete len:83 (+) Transcript_5767:797-1045(+)